MGNIKMNSTSKENRLALKRNLSTNMSQRIFQILFLIISIVLLYFSAVDASEKIIIDNPDWPPFFFGSDKNAPKGIGREIIEMGLKRHGEKFHFERFPIKRSNHYIKTGEIDIALYSNKKKRKAFVLYSKEPLFPAKYRFMVRSDSSIKIRSYKDLNFLVFGYLDGLSFTPELLKVIMRKKKNSEVVNIYSLNNLLNGLAGRYQIFDITADSKLTMIWKAKSMKMQNKVKILDYDIGSKNYYIAVSKKSQNILDKKRFLNNFDRFLKAIKSDGTYEKIFKKYGAIK